MREYFTFHSALLKVYFLKLLSQRLEIEVNFHFDHFYLVYLIYWITFYKCKIGYFFLSKANNSNLKRYHFSYFNAKFFRLYHSILSVVLDLLFWVYHFLSWVSLNLLDIVDIYRYINHFQTWILSICYKHQYHHLFLNELI